MFMVMNKRGHYNPNLGGKQELVVGIYPMMTPASSEMLKDKVEMLMHL